MEPCVTSRSIVSEAVDAYLHNDTVPRAMLYSSYPGPMHEMYDHWTL